MKEFRKTEEGLCICEECKQICKSSKGLINHIRYSHNKNYKEYFDKWIKEEGEDLCKICKKKTEFISLNTGYKDGCCRKHIMKIRYGVESNFQTEDVIKQIKLTKKERYDDKNYNNTEKVKQTKKERYGDEKYNNVEKMKKTCSEKSIDEKHTILEKRIQTCQEKWGVDNAFQSEEKREKAKETKKEKYGDEKYTNREKSKETCLKNNGVEYPLQNKEIFEKSHKSAFLLKQFKDTELWYQASYELDFLEKYYPIYKIQRGPSIEYIFKNEDKVYHSDFYILSKNLVVECKNSYLAKK